MTISKLLTAPLTVIVGITGKQGGSVARALIASDKPYRIRGLSRDITKPAAQAFSEQGVEMVGVHLNADKPEDALKAFAGADIAFAMTNWNEYLNGEKEIAVGKVLVDAAKAAGVKLLVWSALESMTELTKGRFSVQFCDSKAEVTAYARASGVPLALAMPGFNTLNIFVAYYALKRQEDGSYLFTLPIPGATRVPLSETAHDYGLYVQAAIERPELGAGSEVRGGRMISLDEIVATLAQVSGKKIVYKQVDRESWLEGFPPAAQTFMAPILGDMFQSFEAVGFFGDKLPTDEAILARKPRTWLETLKATPRELLPE
ncbi:NAD(P)-binding protein [Mycena maculata]|uniref:NAD(P)-binding protein n=1 Tax=Mycena maculata TaxID=230809 RepID=A0AAD7IP86_9AGAR|nr:NAD(P)-binding protein [Mycena maculata]